MAGQNLRVIFSPPLTYVDHQVAEVPAPLVAVSLLGRLSLAFRETSPSDILISAKRRYEARDPRDSTTGSVARPLISVVHLEVTTSLLRR